MTRFAFNSVAVIFALILAAPASAQEKTAHISTLDWPPYTGGDLPHGGATTQVVRAAFEQAGYKIAVEYRPWKRAIDMALKGTEDVIAYYPGYHCRHREGFVSSEPIGSGPLGFAEHADVPIVWDSVDSLGEKQYKIGTVLGYANTDEFDKKAGTGWIIAIPSNDDITNLKKLARKRIDAAVIDKFVLEYLKATEPSLKKSRDNLRFNARPLEDKTLYLCFRDDEAGQAMLKEFNEGLKAVNPDDIADEYFATAFPN
ncbi:MAG: transporter substrate-binding domain-containing protein [Kiloniellales bacterium]|nr:transporter substrate-binding domain-containing protein [Kiloniellales bacterium]